MHEQLIQMINPEDIKFIVNQLYATIDMTEKHTKEFEINPGHATENEIIKYMAKQDGKIDAYKTVIEFIENTFYDLFN